METYSARKMSQEDALKIINELMYCENPTQRAWLESCESNRDFYYGEQVTKEEKEVLEQRGYYALVINKIRKSIRGLVGLLSGNLPKYGAYSSGIENSVKADILNKMLDHNWANSGGLAHYKSWLKKAAITNIAYQHEVYVSKEGKCKSIMLSYDDVIVSPNSKDRMFRDAYLVGIKKYVPIQHIEKLYGIEKMTTVIPGAMYTDRDDPEVSKERKVFLDKLYSGDKQYVLVYELYRKVYTQDEEGRVKIRLKKQTVLGHEHVYEEDMPDNVREYPIVPVYVEDTENPYKIGEVHFLRELQRFINKCFGVVLANAQTLSNPKIFMEENSIIGDKNEFMDNYNKPGSVSFYRQGASPPVVIGGQPLNQAFFGLYTEAKSEMEWNTIPDDLLGYGERKREDYRSALLERREAVIESFSDFMSTIDSAMVQLARIVIENMRSSYDLPKILKIVDSENLYRRYEEYVQLGLDLRSPETIDQYIAKMQEEGADEETIARILEDAQRCFSFFTAFNEVMEMDVSEDNDIFIIAGSYSSTRGLAMLRLMMELQQIGAVDSSSVLEYAPVDRKEDLMKRYDSLQQAYNTIEKLAAQVEQYEKLVDEKDKSIAQAKAEQYVSQRKVRQQYQEAMVKVKAYIHSKSDQLATKEKMIELNALLNELEKAVSEVESMRTERERGPVRLTPVE